MCEVEEETLTKANEQKWEIHMKVRSLRARKWHEGREQNETAKASMLSYLLQILAQNYNEHALDSMRI